MSKSGTARFVRAVDALSIALAVLAAACLVAAMLIVVYMVAWRALGNSTYWEIELATYLIVATVLLGSPFCLKTRGHIGVDLLAHMLPARHGLALERVHAVLGIAVCLYLAWMGLELTLEALHKGETSGSAWNPARWPFFALMPVGLALTALQYVAELLRPREAAPAPAPGAVSGQGA